MTAMSVPGDCTRSTTVPDMEFSPLVELDAKKLSTVRRFCSEGTELTAGGGLAMEPRDFSKASTERSGISSTTDTDIESVV